MNRSRIVSATPNMEDCYQQLCAKLGELCAQYPEIRTIELIGLTGRLGGYLVAACYPDERDLARQTLLVNVDQAIADVAQPAPPRPGVDQR